MRSYISVLPDLTKVTPRLGLGIPVILLLLLSSFPSRSQQMQSPSVSRATAEEQCAANLKDIYKLITAYLHHTARVLGFPHSLDEIHSLAEPGLFVCPADKQIPSLAGSDTFQTSYEIVNDPLRSKFSQTAPSRIAIVAEKMPNHNGKRFVLFYDGSVRAFDQADFEKLKSASFIDKK